MYDGGQEKNRHYNSLGRKGILLRGRMTNVAVSVPTLPGTKKMARKNSKVDVKKILP